MCIFRLRASVLAICVLFLASALASAQRTGGGRRPPVNSAPPGRGGKTPDLPGYYPGAHASDEGKVEFHSDTILVQVPVVVVDKSGKHIRELKKEDFQLLENGKEQTIGSFEEISSTQKPVAVQKTTPGQFTNVVLDQDKPRSVTVIALDMVNTAYLDQTYARKELIKYLANNIDTSQPLALVQITSKGLKVVSPLTNSPEALQQALKKVSGELPAMQNVSDTAEVAAFTGDTTDLLNPATLGQTQSALNDFVTQGDVDYAQFKQERAIETTMQAFLGLAWSLSGIPGRKTLIWATGGFPFTMDSPSAVPGGYLSVLYERAMQAMNDANVAVYPVDAQGLVNYTPGASSRNLSFGAAGVRQLGNRAWLMNSKQDTLKEFAEMTGGRAFYNTNDLAGAFQRAADDASDYYMLGYYLDTKNTKPGWRELKVKLREKQAEIRARKGFLVTNTTMNPEATRTNDMDFALASPFEATGIPLLMEWGAIKDGDKGKKTIPFVLHISGESVSIEGTHNEINLAVAAMATQPDHKNKDQRVVADNVGQDVKAQLKPDSMANFKSHGMAYKNMLELPPGQYSVRFVVRDNYSGRIGSISAPVTVP